MAFEHKSVLFYETVDSLNINPDGIYVDGTLGGAGHASLVCSRLSSKGTFIGIDQDEDAIKAATSRLEEYKQKTNIRIVKNNYVNFEQTLSKLGISKVDGIMLDLGVSSHQLDTIERGFSYKYDAPLDMRMDKDSVVTAKDIVNTYSENELFRIIKNYGEDSFAKNIAKHICIQRQEHSINTTGELVEIVKAAIPAKLRTNGNPAKRTFQAIRIELNAELDVLEKSVGKMIDLLNENGRLSIITFHSLEDRIVKNTFKEYENPCTCPPSFPICVCGKKSKGRIITKKPVLPSPDEIENNKRSKSAKLRVFEKHFN